LRPVKASQCSAKHDLELCEVCQLERLICQQLVEVRALKKCHKEPPAGLAKAEKLLKEDLREIRKHKHSLELQQFERLIMHYLTELPALPVILGAAIAQELSRHGHAVRIFGAAGGIIGWLRGRQRALIHSLTPKSPHYSMLSGVVIAPIVEEIECRLLVQELLLRRLPLSIIRRHTRRRKERREALQAMVEAARRRPLLSRLWRREPRQEQQQEEVDEAQQLIDSPVMRFVRVMVSTFVCACLHESYGMESTFGVTEAEWLERLEKEEETIDYQTYVNCMADNESLRAIGLSISMAMLMEKYHSGLFCMALHVLNNAAAAFKNTKATS